MPANTAPIFSIVGAIDSGAANNAGAILGVAASTAQDGSGTNIFKIFTAGANGSYVQKIRYRPIGTTAATVSRIFISSSATTSTTNTWLYDEITLPANTLSQTVASSIFELPLNIALDPNYLIYVTFATVTGTGTNGYSVVVIAGDY